MLAIIFLGALPAMIITRWADRFGRRRLLVWSIFGYIIFSALTALAPDARTFTFMQFLQQVFVVAEGAIVWTMAAEELPADSRGFGFGVLAMNSALGVGFAAIVWSISLCATAKSEKEAGVSSASLPHAAPAAPGRPSASASAVTVRTSG